MLSLSRSYSHLLQENIIVWFDCIYSPFKTKKMDSLLLLIKKHNNKTAGYNDSLHHLLTKTNKMRLGIHHIQHYIRIIKLQNI